MQVKAGENVVWNAVPGELVLLNADSGGYYALDDVGADIWRLLADSSSVAEVKERMVELYDGEPGRIAADVDRLVADLLENRLLVRTDRDG